MNEICAVVVFYNPDQDSCKNIASFIDDVEKVYIIDNSSVDNSIYLDLQDNRIHYIPLMKNKGLAYALNYGCKIAIDEGFKYALTMDQDSCFEPGAVRNLTEFMKSNNDYAIVSPNVKSLYYDEHEKTEKVAYVQYPIDVNTERNWTMTSGSLMNLADYNRVNGFDHDMFIAHLDIDLGIKFDKIHKKIIVIGNSIIHQHFGNSKPKRILWKKVHPSFASPVRTYYLFRNQKYLEKKYGRDMKKFIHVNLIKFVIKITLFEDEKIEKYRMMHRGIRDAKKGVMGEYKNTGNKS